MARSDDSRQLGRAMLAGLLCLGAVAVTGCSTTQDEAARLQLNSARIRVAETHTVVPSAGRRVRVTAVSLVTRPHGATAFVVEVHNPGPGAIGDLPISVGLRGAKPLNAYSADEETAYFGSHLPSIAAGEGLTWVWTTRRALPRGASPYAHVGDRPSPATSRVGAGTPPRISARVVGRRSTAAGTRLQISLHNDSTVPQYQLQVYAIARRDARAVAAGAATVPHLGSGKTERFTVPVIGSLAHARLELAAVPTIFQ